MYPILALLLNMFALEMLDKKCGGPVVGSYNKWAANFRPLCESFKSPIKYPHTDASTAFYGAL